MNRYYLPTILAIALLGFSSCATEQSNQHSGNVGVTSPISTPPSVVSSPDKVSGSKVIQITDGNYEQEVLQSRIPVLMNFWAPWSAPERMLAPTIEAIANEYTGRAKVGKVNVDDIVELARKFNIKGIPTLIVITNGSEQERVIGVTSKEAIGRMLDKKLKDTP